MATRKATESADLRKLYRGLQKDAQHLLQGKFQAIMERHRAADASLGKASAAAAAALSRVLGRDGEYAAAIKPLVSAASKELLKLERAEAKLGRPMSREAALGLLS